MNSDIAEAAARARFNGIRYNSESYADGHLAKVAALTKALGGDDDAVSIAWLHDVMEDTHEPSEGWHYWFVDGHGFSDTVFRSVRALTKSFAENYEDYIHRICVVDRGHNRVRLVKYADSLVNLSSIQPHHNLEVTRQRVLRYTNNLTLLAPLVFP